MPRGPSEIELGKSFVYRQARQSIVEHLESEEDFQQLYGEAIDLPARDLCLHVPLPRLFTTRLDRISEAIKTRDDEVLDRELPDVVREFDTWPVRAKLARGLVELRDEGRIDGRLAAVALADLASESTAFIESSLIEAVAVATGATKTPAGILIAR